MKNMNKLMKVFGELIETIRLQQDMLEDMKEVIIKAQEREQEAIRRIREAIDKDI